jgi:hypothetical protein
MNLIKFSFLFLLIFSFIPLASCQSVTFNDLNLVSRDVAVYSVSETGTTLIDQGSSSNMTIELSQNENYQIVIEPSHSTWFDDPRNALHYLTSDAMGQTLTFLVFAFLFGGIIKIIVR